jgi:tricarballylate dehydrogenase
LFQTKGLRLLLERGAVRGARARKEQGEFDFRARAVILATGSFQGNQEMMIKYVGPEIAYLPLLIGSPHNTGDGLEMAMEAGAQLVNLTVCHIRTTDKFLSVGPSRHLMNIYPMGLYINQNCQRFVDEGTADSDTIANAIAYQPGAEAALIFDEKARAQYPDEFNSYPRRDEVISVADSLEELAVKINVSAEGMKKVVHEFNTAVRDGQAPSLPIPKTSRAYKLDRPPYYGFYPVLPGMNHPLGGLKIDTKTRVLDREGNPLPGLYAAGSIVNWAFGKVYEKAGIKTFKGSYHAGGSSGLATALVFGRMAGENAAKEALRS